MFTPEDEIDEIHLELGRWRRLLDAAERVRGDSGTDYVEIDKTIVRCRFHIDRLERALAVELAPVEAEGEAYDRDAA